MPRRRRPSTSLLEHRPTVTADGRGYTLDGDVIAGFDDRTDLSFEQRTTIARLCRRYDRESLSDQQAELLRAFDDHAPRVPSPLLAGFFGNSDDLHDAGIRGFLDDLTEEQRRVVANPASHPSLGGCRYPLTSGELATLCGASVRQVRHWADIGLIPSYRIDGERRFYSAAAVRGMALAGADKNEVSAVAAIARGGEEGERLLRLVGATIATVASRGPASESAIAMEAVGSELVRRSADWLGIHSTSLRSDVEHHQSSRSDERTVASTPAPVGSFGDKGDALHVGVDEALFALRALTHVGDVDTGEVVAVFRLFAAAQHADTNPVQDAVIEPTRLMLQGLWRCWVEASRVDVQSGEYARASWAQIADVILEDWRTQVAKYKEPSSRAD